MNAKEKIAAMITNPKKLLSVPQFAEEIGVTHACIRRWLLERKICHVKLGKLVRIPAEEVSRLVTEGFRPARPAPEERR